MLYLMFIRLAGWMALLARSTASKDAILAQYKVHYNGHRPHRSRQLRPPPP